MPRRGSAGGRGASRPTFPSRAPSAPTQQQQTRPATTLAAPGARQQQQGQQGQQSQGPGMIGQIASTAAGVAIGSSIGHAIGGFFGGGSSSVDQADPQQGSVASQQQQTGNGSSWGNSNCEGAAKQFTKCMDDQGGNMQICGWYLEQLKACQTAASQY